MAEFIAQQVSINNGSKAVVIDSNESPENVRQGDFLFITGNDPVAINRTYINSDNKPVIELKLAWSNGNKSNQPAIVLPTTSEFKTAAEALKNANVLVNDNFQALFDYQTKTGEVTFNATDGTTVTLKTLKQQQADNEAIHPHPYAMRKVEFEARRAANNEKFAASGFVHFGQQFINTYQKKIGEGLYTLGDISSKISLGRNDTFGLGDSKTTASVINLSGVITELNHKGSGRAVDIKFPPAEDGTRTYDSATGISVTHATQALAFASETDNNKVVTDRVDMWGFEAFLREINDTDPFVYDKGLIQSLATNINGVSTVTDNVRPITYFAWYENDEESRGKGVNWQTASEAQRTAIASDPDNNLYFDDATGKFYQWGIRGRSFAGVGNGEWNNIDAVIGDLQFDSFNKITPTMPGPTKFSAEGNIGVFTAENNSHCHLLVCGTVNRLNQGAYHPSINPSGADQWLKKGELAGTWSDHAEFGLTREKCFFNAVTSGEVGRRGKGSILSAESGRPDARYYDVIYASGQGGVCRDMRYSAWGLTQEDFAEADLKVKSGEYRGREKLVKSYVIQKTYKSSNFDSKRYTFDVTDLALPDLPLGYASSGSNNGYILGKQGELFPILKITVGSSDISILTTPAGYSEYRGEPESLIPVVLEIPFDTEVAGEYTHTEVTGDPANILQCTALKDGWVGSWNPTVFTGQNINHPFTKPIIEGALVDSAYSRDGGESWSLNSNTPYVDYIRNKRTTSADVEGVMIYNYLVNAALTESSATTKPRTAPSAILISDSATQAKELGYSLTGKINVSNSNQAIELRLNQLGTDLETGNLSASKETKHVAIPLLSPENASPAFKALSYNVVENQQGYINYAYTELKYDDAASDWGDDGKIHIADNQATRLDDNGNSVVYGTARIVEPLGWIKNDK